MARRPWHFAGRLLIRSAVAHDGAVQENWDSTWLRAAMLGVLLAAGAVLAAVLEVPDVEEARAWVDGAGRARWAAMVLALGLVLLAPVPRTALSILVGLVAGFGPGLAVALAGALLAALAAFGLSRTLGRSAVTRLAGARLARLDDLLDRRGFAAVLTGRLLPVVPFVVLSYAAGLTAIRWGPYVAATALGLVPSTVVQVGLGASAGAVASRVAPSTMLLLLAAAVVLAVLAGGAWHLRRRAVARRTG